MVDEEVRLPRIVGVRPVRYGVVFVEFDDGFAGEYDLTEKIAEGEILEPLRDPAYFNTVAVSEYGHSFGWNLDEIGAEIDFGADATRTHIETERVRDLADQHRHAAE